MPDKEEKKKGMDQFCVGEEKDLGAAEGRFISKYWYKIWMRIFIVNLLSSYI